MPEQQPSNSNKTITREQYAQMDDLHKIAADHAAKNGTIKIVEKAPA